MFRTISPLWLVVGWLLVLSALVAASVADGARISTSLLLFVLTFFVLSAARLMLLRLEQKAGK